MHNHRYNSPMRSTGVEASPSLTFWPYMQNHRYFIYFFFYLLLGITTMDSIIAITMVHLRPWRGPWKRNQMELLSTCACNYPAHRFSMTTMSIIAMLSRCPNTPKPTMRPIRLQENTNEGVCGVQYIAQSSSGSTTKTKSRASLYLYPSRSALAHRTP